MATRPRWGKRSGGVYRLVDGLRLFHRDRGCGGLVVADGRDRMGSKEGLARRPLHILREGDAHVAVAVGLAAKGLGAAMVFDGNRSAGGRTQVQGPLDGEIGVGLVVGASDFVDWAIHAYTGFIHAIA